MLLRIGQGATLLALVVMLLGVGGLRATHGPNRLLSEAEMRGIVGDQEPGGGEVTPESSCVGSFKCHTPFFEFEGTTKVCAHYNLELLTRKVCCPATESGKKCSYDTTVKPCTLDGKALRVRSVDIVGSGTCNTCDGINWGKAVPVDGPSKATGDACPE